MGMSSGGGKPGQVTSDINVTPLIDVLLVLLIIFLVVMPIMMKMETLQVPRKIDDQHEAPDPNAIQITVTVKVSGGINFNDGSSEAGIEITGADLLRTLRPKLENAHMGSEKVVFVDFEEAVPWGNVVATMDSIRSLASDINHDEIKVALKIHEDKPAAPP